MLDLRADTAEGVGKVQATHLDATGDADHNRSGPKSASTGDPLNVVADRVLAAHREQFIHYEGHVRAWRGGDLVESSSLDVYRTERRLASGFRVQTSHLQRPAQQAAPNPFASGPSRRETQPVTIRADRLEYMDEGRKASYRGNVELLTENTTLKADHLEVYFSKGANVEASEIERAVAEGQVGVTQQGRRAAGEHADYDAASGKIVLTGGPPTLYDAENGFTTGQRLTFYIRDDRLLVDGGNNSPTLTKHRVAQ
jgi:lipopolysaccharide transport protein LptA